MQNSVRVEYVGGPINGAYRYYSSVGVAKAAAISYVSRYRQFFSDHPYCELSVRFGDIFKRICLIDFNSI